MERIIAPAKVNLTLCIGKKLESGYHPIYSIMQEISSLFDVVKLRKTINEGIEVKCESSDIDEKVKCNYLNHNERNNLAYIAANLMFEKYAEKIKGFQKGIKINISKKIPVAAGLGGGSSDAAAVIKGMDRLYGLGMNEEEMIKMATKIGMDVPFFILGGTVYATGCGEKLKRIKSIPKNIYLVLAKPNLSISAKEAYLAFDYNKIGDELIKEDMPEEIKNMLTAIKNEDISLIAENLYNDFEGVIINDEISEIKSIMKKSEALNALMSGSGPTVFGITEKEFIAREIYKSLEKENFKFIYITKTGEKY